MRRSGLILAALLAVEPLGAQQWRAPVAVDIPARFDINLGGVPSRCYKVARPPDHRITAEVKGPGTWNLCVGDSNCPYDCMSGNNRKVSTDHLTDGPSYFVMVERKGSEATASLEIYPTALGGVPGKRAVAGTWIANVPQKNFRKGGYRIVQSGDDLSLVSWDGKATPAKLQDMSTIVAEGGKVTGRISADGRRIDWNNASYWESDAASGGISVAGTWTAVIPSKSFRKAGYRITQSGSKLTLVSWDGKTSLGYLKDANTIVAEEWKGTGIIRGDGKRIDWDNGSYWER
ncbi:MAG: hypothetical protein HY821_06580 [Acidobacteria bacterium]|nr:hypothetical protein [Acidobacteriota bacterium]